MRRLTDRVDGRALAVARIGVGLAAAVNAVEAHTTLERVARGDSIRLPEWPWLPNVTPLGADVLLAVSLLAAVALVAGFWARPSAVLLAAALGATLVWDQQTYSNHLTLSAWCALWLALGACDARWSLRARLHGPGDVHLRDQLLLMTQLSVVYLFTGIVKVNPSFLSGSVIRDVARFDVPVEVSQLLAVGTVVAELSLAAGLWIPRVRWAAAAGGVLLHLTIPWVMHDTWALMSFSLLMLSLYPLFLAPCTPDREPRR